MCSVLVCAVFWCVQCPSVAVCIVLVLVYAKCLGVCSVLVWRGMYSVLVYFVSWYECPGVYICMVVLVYPGQFIAMHWAGEVVHSRIMLLFLSR